MTHHVDDFEAHEDAARAYRSLEYRRRPGRTWPRPKKAVKFSPVFTHYLHLLEGEALCGDFVNSLRLRSYFDNELVNAYVDRGWQIMFFDQRSGGKLSKVRAEDYSELLAPLILAESKYWTKMRALKMDVHPERAARLERWANVGTTPTRIRAAFRLARNHYGSPSIKIMEALVPRVEA